MAGAHFKKWCVMQSKIKSGAMNEVSLSERGLYFKFEDNILLNLCELLAVQERG